MHLPPGEEVYFTNTTVELELELELEFELSSNLPRTSSKAGKVSFQLFLPIIPSSRRLSIQHLFVYRKISTISYPFAAEPR
jgi:hypothetical protein